MWGPALLDFRARAASCRRAGPRAWGAFRSSEAAFKVSEVAFKVSEAARDSAASQGSAAHRV
jgi:hypothetical protein